MVVNVFRTDPGAARLVAVLQCERDDIVADIRDEAIREMVNDWLTAGLFSDSLMRTVPRTEPIAFLEALVESLDRSSYWAAERADAPTAAPAWYQAVG